MTNFFKRFAQDESGAVTVDFVVLTAAVVGLSIAVGTVIYDQVEGIAGDINTELKTVNEAGLDKVIGG